MAGINKDLLRGNELHTLGVHTRNHSIIHNATNCRRHFAALLDTEDRFLGPDLVPFV